MLEAGKVYKHENCTDVAIYVALVLEETPESIKVHVHWVNVAHRRHFIIEQEDISIKKADAPRWRPFEVRFT